MQNSRRFMWQTFSDDFDLNMHQVGESVRMSVSCWGGLFIAHSRNGLLGGLFDRCSLLNVRYFLFTE